MGGPTWLGDGFAALMLLTASYCVSRLLLARRLHRVIEPDVEFVHIAMGIVMAGMFVAALQFVPNGLAALGFGFATLWFGWRAVEAFRRSPNGWTGCHHAVPHVVLSFAMLYMVVAQPNSVTAMTSMSQGMGSTVQFAPLGALLVVALFGYAIWYANQLAPSGAAEAFELAGVTITSPDLPSGGTGGSGLATVPPETQQPSEPFLSPRLAICCHIVMCVAMGYMLISML